MGEEMLRDANIILGSWRFGPTEFSFGWSLSRLDLLHHIYHRFLKIEFRFLAPRWLNWDTV